MSLTACRECHQPVSTEAATCPHCGVGAPAPVVVGELPKAPPLPPGAADPMGGPPLQIRGVTGIDYSNPLTYLIIIATVAVLGGGYFAYQHFLGGVQVTGSQVEATIEERFQTINDKASLSASCPDTVTLRKDKIVDCSLERTDKGTTTHVFITGTDNSGHFTMQVEDPRILIDFP